MPGVRALLVAGCSLMSVLVHVVGLRSCMAWRVAVLRAAVGAVQPCAFCIWIHCCDFKLVVTV